MNWYALIKIAVPVPQVENLPSFQGVEPPFGYISIDERMTPDEAKEQLNEYPEMKYVGSGFYGTAFTWPGERIMKYTVHRDEVSAAHVLMELQEQRGGPLPGVVTVFDVKKMKDVYAIVLEKVDPLSSSEKQIFMELTRIPFPTKTWADLALSYVLEAAPQKRKKFGPEYSKLFDDVLTKLETLLKNLAAIKASSWDLHTDNVGKRQDGEFVVLDIGGLYNENSKLIDELPFQTQDKLRKSFPEKDLGQKEEPRINE